MRVAVEPARPGDMPALVEGLRLLHKADPMVQVAVQETGEHVLCAAGAQHAARGGGDTLCGACKLVGCRKPMRLLCGR